MKRHTGSWIQSFRAPCPVESGHMALWAHHYSPTKKLLWARVFGTWLIMTWYIKSLATWLNSVSKLAREVRLASNSSTLITHKVDLSGDQSYPELPTNPFWVTLLEWKDTSTLEMPKVLKLCARNWGQRSDIVFIISQFLKSLLKYKQ